MLTVIQKMIIVAVIGFGLGFGGCFIWLTGKDARLARSMDGSNEVATLEEGSSTGVALQEAMQEKVNALKEQIKNKEQAIAEGNGVGVGAPTAALVAATISTSASISVHDQKAGNIVNVSSVSLNSPGWLVVYDYVGGQLGHVLGAYYRNTGSHTNVGIELLRNTVTGSTYAVTISTDDGDRNYDYRKDIPTVDASGKTILATFTAL